MTLPRDRGDRENQKFRDTGLPDKTRVAVELEAFHVSVSASSITNTSPAISNSSASALAANTARKFAVITNNNGFTAYLNLGASAVVGTGIPLGPNSSFTINADNLWTGSIEAIKSGAGASTLHVMEGT